LRDQEPAASYYGVRIPHKIVEERPFAQETLLASHWCLKVKTVIINREEEASVAQMSHSDIRFTGLPAYRCALAGYLLQYDG
jgi:hypothetical protein